MVLAVFRSLEGESLEDFSVRLAERWRVGQRGLDNGVILLVFHADRRMRMEVGYGLEPVLPDAVASRIISEVIAPRFREGRYAAGLEGAVNEVYARVAKPGVVPAARRFPVEDWVFFVAFGVVAFFIVAVIATAFLKVLGNRPGVRHRRRGYTGGPDGWYVPAGSWGGGGGGGFSGGGGSFGGGGASGSW